MKHTFKYYINKLGFEVKRTSFFNTKYSSLYHKYKDFTMVPRHAYIDNLNLVDTFGHLKGNVVECGVWRGGMTAGMAEILGDDRKYYLCDSFQGLPPATEKDGHAALAWQRNTSGATYHDNCTAEESFSKEAMKLTGVDFELVKGWFDVTLPTLQAGPIAVLRLDADWYDSMYLCFEHLYPQVVNNGLIIIDDYFVWEGCSKAVHAYLSKTPCKIYATPNGTAYIIKVE